MSYHENHCVLPQSSQFVIRVALGPTSAGRVISTINQWLKCSGTEWTVDRLKSLRTAALQLRAGNHDVAKEIYRVNSIAYRKDTLIPRGPFAHVFTLFLKMQRPSCLRRIESVLRVYTSLVLTNVSQKQADKAKTAITEPFNGSDAELRKITDSVCQYARSKLKPRLVQYGFYNHDGTPKIRRANLSRLKAYTSTHKSSKVASNKDLDRAPYGKGMLSLATTTVWPKPFVTDPEAGLNGIYPFEIFDFLRSNVWQESVDNDYAGHISFIQERGAKARVVAVPTCLLQWGFEPLHDWLDNVLRKSRRSSVHDHNKGAFWISEKLAKGLTLWSYDLSSATDRFPRSIQIELLNTLGLRDFADALEEVCQEDWYITSGPYKGESWKYSVGQPMGLYSSFPLFTLTHMVLLDTLWNELGGDPESDAPYQILGDDVIICDRWLSKYYFDALKSLGLQISPAKSIISSRVAEFAGFVAYKTQQSVAVFRPYKHGTEKYLHNPVNLIHSLGSALGRSGNPYWKRLVHAFQLTKSWRNPDLSPLISQDDAPGVNPDLIDTNRLTNLLSTSMQIAGNHKNTWTGEMYDLTSLEVLAEVLLDKQDSYDYNITNMSGPKTPDMLLSTPDIDHQLMMNKHQGNALSIKDDPLITESLRFIDSSTETIDAIPKRDPVPLEDTSEDQKSNWSFCKWD